MNLEEGKAKLIQAWGTLGSEWGINRTMAQVHALLLVSPNSLSADDIMTQLNISRGNANMNLRALMDWGLIMKAHKAGDRKEYFFAEKDMWRIAQQVAIHRKKKELDPLKALLQELKTEVKGNEDDTQINEFKKIINDLNGFADIIDRTLETIIKSEKTWTLKLLVRLMRTKE